MTSKIKYINLSNKIYRVTHISFFTKGLVAEETILSAATVPEDEVFDVMDYPGLKVTLTKKLNEYQAEVNSQLSSGLLKQGSEAYQEAMKNIQDFSAKIYDASKELIELQDKLNQIKIDTIQNVIDAFERRTSNHRCLAYYSFYINQLLQNPFII